MLSPRALIAASIAALLAWPALAAAPPPENWGRDRSVDVEHVRIVLELNLPERRMTGHADVRVRALAAATSTIELDAVDLEISGVTDGGRPVPFTHDGDVLRAQAAPPLRDGEVRELRIEYGGSPESGLHWVTRGREPAKMQVWSQGEMEESRLWFPVHDHPVERITSETLITVAEPLAVVGNGVLVGVTSPRPGYRTFHHRMDFAHVPYLVSIAVGDWATTRGEWEGVELSFHVPKELASRADHSFSRTAEILEILSEDTGVKYPYPVYRQVAVSEFIFGGMENITATTLTDDTLHLERDHRDYPSDSLVAHEAAHQWFGDYVTCRDWHDNWINEGFATYYAALAMGRLHGPEQDAVEAAGLRDAGLGADGAHPRAIVTHRYHGPRDLFDSHAYGKSAAIIRTLRHEIGDAAFQKAVHAFLTTYAGRSVSTQDVIASFEETTGRDVSGFFDQWFFRPGAPDLLASWKHEDGRVTLDVSQRQAGEPYRMMIDVQILGEGSRSEHVVKLDAARESFTFDVAAPPKAVLVDPRGHVLRRLETDRPAAEAIWVLQAAPDIGARMEAAAELGDDVSRSSVRAALVKALREAQEWPVRKASAAALEHAASADATAALVERLSDEPDSRVRRAIAEALGGHDEPHVAVALARALASDASTSVRAGAATGLGKHRSAGDDRALEAALVQRSHREDVFGAALSALFERRSPRMRAIALASAAPLDRRKGEQPVRVRSNAVKVLGMLAARDPDELRRGEIRETLARLLEDPSYRVRTQAIDALVASADAGAVPPLKRLSSTAHVATRAHALAALRDLEGKTGEAARLQGLADALAEERKAREELEERVRKMEARSPESSDGGGVAGE